MGNHISCPQPRCIDGVIIAPFPDDHNTATNANNKTGVTASPDATSKAMAKQFVVDLIQLMKVGTLCRRAAFVQFDTDGDDVESEDVRLDLEESEEMDEDERNQRIFGNGERSRRNGTTAGNDSAKLSTSIQFANDYLSKKRRRTSSGDVDDRVFLFILVFVFNETSLDEYLSQQQLINKMTISTSYAFSREKWEEVAIYPIAIGTEMNITKLSRLAEDEPSRVFKIKSMDYADSILVSVVNKILQESRRFVMRCRWKGEEEKEASMRVAFPTQNKECEDHDMRVHHCPSVLSTPTSSLSGDKRRRVGDVFDQFFFVGNKNLSRSYSLWNDSSIDYSILDVELHLCGSLRRITDDVVVYQTYVYLSKMREDEIGSGFHGEDEQEVVEEEYMDVRCLLQKKRRVVAASGDGGEEEGSQGGVDGGYNTELLDILAPKLSVYETDSFALSVPAPLGVASGQNIFVELSSRRSDLVLLPVECHFANASDETKSLGRVIQEGCLMHEDQRTFNDEDENDDFYNNDGLNNNNNDKNNKNDNNNENDNKHSLFKWRFSAKPFPFGDYNGLKSVSVRCDVILCYSVDVSSKCVRQCDQDDRALMPMMKSRRRWKRDTEEESPLPPWPYKRQFGPIDLITTQEVVQEKKCPNTLTKVTKGTIDCTNDNFLGSVCQLACNPGYYLFNERYVCESGGNTNSNTNNNIHHAVWSPSPESTFCHDVDECSPDTNACAHILYSICHNLPGSFECRCPVGTSNTLPGFSSDRCFLISTFNGTVKLTQMEYSSVLNDSSSTAYRVLAMSVKAEMTRLFGLFLELSRFEIIVQRFSSGSVITHFDIHVDSALVMDEVFVYIVGYVGRWHPCSM